MAKETLTEQMVLGDLPPADEKPQPKQASWLVWAAENGIFVFTTLLVLFAIFFVVILWLRARTRDGGT